MIGPPTPPLIPTSGFVQKPLALPLAFDAQAAAATTICIMFCLKSQD